MVQLADDTLLICDDNDIKMLYSYCKNPVRICICTIFGGAFANMAVRLIGHNLAARRKNLW